MVSKIDNTALAAMNEYDFDPVAQRRWDYFQEKASFTYEFVLYLWIYHYWPKCPSICVYVYLYICLAVLACCFSIYFAATSFDQISSTVYIMHTLLSLCVFVHHTYIIFVDNGWMQLFIHNTGKYHYNTNHYNAITHMMLQWYGSFVNYNIMKHHGPQ